MHIKKNHFTCDPRLAIATTVLILFASNFATNSSHGLDLWTEVHPRANREATQGIRHIHFIDTETGWAEKQGTPLRTFDGGGRWRLEPLGEINPGFSAHFISPTIGWRIKSQQKNSLLDDIDFYHSTDGGQTWQARRGKVTELVQIVNAFQRDLEDNKRSVQSCIYFIDEQHGWLLGHTGTWTREFNELGWPLGMALAGNFLCSTRDGGQSWKCQVHIYETELIGLTGINTWLRVPRDVDFVNRQVGWITPRQGWMYHTTDGGITWKLGGVPFLWFDEYLTKIDFVDESRGWAIGTAGVWFTADGGRSWTKKRNGSHTALYADADGVFVGGGTGSEINPVGILHSRDDGNTWQVQWEGWEYISYIGHHEITGALWAGGKYGIILKRPYPTAVTPRGKIAAVWGNVKAGHSQR